MKKRENEFHAPIITKKPKSTQVIVKCPVCKMTLLDFFNCTDDSDVDAILSFGINYCSTCGARVREDVPDYGIC